MSDRVPLAIEAEESVLGACLIDAGTIDRVRPLLKAADLYSDKHRVVYQHMLALHDVGQPVDLITVHDALERAGKLDSIGGVAQLMHLADTVPTTVNAAAYAALVADAAGRRRLLHALEQARDAVLASSADEAQARAEALIHAARMDSPDAATFGLEAVQAWVHAQWEATQGKGGPVLRPLKTGLTYLDRHIHLRPREATLISGRAGGFKTAMALHLALEWAQQRRPVLFYSLEMDRDSLSARVAAHVADIGAFSLRQGPDIRTWERVWDALQDVGDWPLRITDAPVMAVDNIRAHTLRQATEGFRPEVLILDYTDLVAEPRMRDERGDQLLFRVVGEMRRLARELSLHAVVLHQLNEPQSDRSDMRPRRSDLANARSVVRMVDLSLMLWYPASYPDRYEDASVRHLEVIVDKQRQGPTGSVWVDLDRETGRFADLPPEAWPVRPGKHGRDSTVLAGR